jgi:hypothetical protein
MVTKHLSLKFLFLFQVNLLCLLHNFLKVNLICWEILFLRKTLGFQQHS